MNIKLEDYLTEDEIKEIVVEEFKDQIRRKLPEEKDFTKMLINFTLTKLWEVVQEEVPNYKEIIKKKIIRNIGDVGMFNIFRREGEYECTKNSVAQDILEECVRNNKNIIEDKVKEILSEVSKTDLKYDIEGLIEKYFENIFNGGE